LSRANTLAYYQNSSITAVKSLITFGNGVDFVKLFGVFFMEPGRFINVSNVVKVCSLQQSVSKFMPNTFYDIDF